MHKKITPRTLGKIQCFSAFFGVPGGIRTHGLSLRSDLMNGLLFTKYTRFVRENTTFVDTIGHLFSMTVQKTFIE